MRVVRLLLLLTPLLAGTVKAEPGRQVAVEAPDGGLPYLLYVPAGDAPEGGWPLLVFLHGSGERGDDLDKVKVHGPPKLVESTPALQRFVVVSPQCPDRADGVRRFENARVKAVIDQVLERHPVDADRLYLTGLSMGGFATWALLDAYPDLFAAAAPVCGRAERVDPARIRHVPVWVFHGAEDRAVPVEASREMVARLRAADAREVRYTEYNHVGHASWDPAYATGELYRWLLGKRRAR